MHILARPFALPKAGNSADDYEDAYWPRRAFDQEVAAIRLAVADGATETSFAGLWATLLVRAYCRGRLAAGTLAAALPRLQRNWGRRVGAKPLPWYAEEKVRSGAFSSLAGLTLHGPAADETGDGAGGAWESFAVGDSCLFQVRSDELIVAFPLGSSGQFNNRPALLSSNPARNEGLAGALRCAAGRWEAGDEFYLMTDALACWFLRAVESGERPWLELRDLAAERGATAASAFAEWVADLRGAGRLRNDDVTLLWARAYGHGGAGAPAHEQLRERGGR